MIYLSRNVFFVFHIFQLSPTAFFCCLLMMNQETGSLHSNIVQCSLRSFFSVSERVIIFWHFFSMFWLWSFRFYVTQYSYVMVVIFQVLRHQVQWVSTVHPVRRAGDASSGQDLSPTLLYVCSLWSPITERRTVCYEGWSHLLSPGLWEGVRSSCATVECCQWLVSIAI